MAESWKEMMEGDSQFHECKCAKDFENAMKALEETQQDAQEKLFLLREIISRLHVSKIAIQVCHMKEILKDVCPKIVDVLIEFKAVFWEEEVNQNKRENLSTLWEATWGTYKNKETRCLEFWAHDGYLMGEMVHLLEKYGFIRYLKNNDKKEFCVWKEEMGEILEDTAARRSVLWKQVTDLLERAEVILAEVLNLNDKEKGSALWEEFLEIYRNVDAGSIDFGRQNIVLWTKIEDHLVKVMDLIKEGIGLRRDAPGIQEEEK